MDGPLAIFKLMCRESGWIKTLPNKGWFTYFRWYGPIQAFFDKTWTLPDIEEVEGTNYLRERKPDMRTKLTLLALAAVLALAALGSSAETQTVSSEDLMRRTVERRAVEAAVWGMPLVNFDAMRQAYFRDASATYNDILYFSRPADWKFQTTTPNNSTSYVMFFVHLKDGPVVVEVPPADDAALFGTLIDAWNVPLLDVGNAGEDKGQGGKYLLLPPGDTSQAPAGYIPVPSTTYNMYSLLRVIPKTGSADDVAKALAYLKKLKIYLLSSAATPSAARFIDIAGKTFEGITAYDASFYTSLARMVAEEPVQERDLTIMGQLRSLGIGKEVTFQPDAATTSILQRAIVEAHAFMLEGFRNDGFVWWPQRTWRFLVGEEVIKSKMTYVLPGRVMLDERAFLFFGAFGGTHNPAPNLYVKTFEDGKGHTLNGSNTYRLRVPANVPTTQFWAVVAYDNATAGFIREAPVVGLDSYNPQLKKNADGSVDLYFAPKAPQGQEMNWISTREGRPFFLLFRNYAPEKSVLERTSTWVLNDLEPIE